ncbi:MAG: hypothetical protein ACPG1C_07845 [Alphaproteobacteria bacterium]
MVTRLIAFAVLALCLTACFHGSTPITNGYKIVNLGGDRVIVNVEDRIVIDDLRP